MDEPTVSLRDGHIAYRLSPPVDEESSVVNVWTSYHSSECRPPQLAAGHANIRYGLTLSQTLENADDKG